MSMPDEPTGGAGRPRCRVLDSLANNVTQPGIFTAADTEDILHELEQSIDAFQRQHERTYLGRNTLRRFENREKCERVAPCCAASIWRTR